MVIMAYFSQETKKKMAPKVKALGLKYGVKMSMRVRHHSTVVVTVKSGAIDFIGNYVHGHAWDKSIGINPYWYKDHFTGVPLKFLTELFAILKGEGWYDRSDAQSDYFDTAWYVDVDIGHWNKPYILTQ
jgi:hypothetical protein